MSRVGRLPIGIPSGVTVNVGEENLVTVKGPKGELVKKLHKDINISVEENQVVVTRPSEHKLHRALHGTVRAVVNNMIMIKKKTWRNKKT
jgi:large subunit ribosomal protein L6